MLVAVDGLRPFAASSPWREPKMRAQPWLGSQRSHALLGVQLLCGDRNSDHSYSEVCCKAVPARSINHPAGATRSINDGPPFFSIASTATMYQ